MVGWRDWHKAVSDSELAVETASCQLNW